VKGRDCAGEVVVQGSSEQGGAKVVRRFRCAEHFRGAPAAAGAATEVQRCRGVEVQVQRFNRGAGSKTKMEDSSTTTREKQSFIMVLMAILVLGLLPWNKKQEDNDDDTTYYYYVIQ